MKGHKVADGSLPEKSRPFSENPDHSSSEVERTAPPKRDTDHGLSPGRGAAARSVQPASPSFSSA